MGFFLSKNVLGTIAYLYKKVCKLESKLQFFMTRLIIPYSVLIIVYGLFMTLLILASPHHVDKDLLVVNFSSLVIFPLTGYLLYKSSNGQTKNKSLVNVFLLLTALIFTYYSYDLLKDTSDVSWFDFLPLAALMLSLLFLIIPVQKRQPLPKESGITSWEEYWKMFDTLCNSLNNDNKQIVVTELKEAQKHVNGLTDGWYEFLNEFEKVNNTHNKTFSTEQAILAKTLIQNLKSSLNNR